MKTGVDSEDGEPVVNLFTNDSGILRPNSNNMNWEPQHRQLPITAFHGGA